MGKIILHVKTWTEFSSQDVGMFTPCYIYKEVKLKVENSPQTAFRLTLVKFRAPL
jgi:hypothetical protein